MLFRSSARARSLGLIAKEIDGNDVLGVDLAARELVRDIRDGGGPRFLHLHTYRLSGHTGADPATYRPKEEVERWMERDPLPIARARLIELGHGEEDIEATEREVRATLDRAVEAALAAPYPDPEADAATEFAA